ncbi:unannotated protein [freshwater metagenome]|uniref:Unannotated protein n=1 Tax=freshwater metagenome TaxID=449393 RepID=A0A6J7BH20_9ZZZZ
MVSQFTVAAVARRLGIAPATLRTWDRRYGLGPGDHSAGAHRRYSEEDFSRLQMMRRLIAAGIAPGDAAQRALAGDPLPLTHTDSADVPAKESAAELDDSLAPLLVALHALDMSYIRETLRTQLKRNGVIATWHHSIAPLLREIGEEWQERDDAIVMEHSLSTLLMDVFGELAQVKTPINKRPILLSAAPEELHVLPLYALAAALGEKSVATHLLGARTPSRALAAVMAKNGPLAVFIWSQSCESARLLDFSCFPSIRPAPRIVTGGPGFAEIVHPAGATHARSLEEALSLIGGPLGL